MSAPPLRPLLSTLFLKASYLPKIHDLQIMNPRSSYIP
jgi:hypothetical protein